MEAKATLNNNKALMINKRKNTTSSTTSNSPLNSNKTKDKGNKRSMVNNNSNKRTFGTYKTPNRTISNNKRGMTSKLMKMKMNRMGNNRMMIRMRMIKMNKSKSKKATPTNSLCSHKRGITTKITTKISTTIIRDPLKHSNNNRSKPIHKRRESSTLFNEL